MGRIGGGSDFFSFSLFFLKREIIFFRVFSFLFSLLVLYEDSPSLCSVFVLESPLAAFI